MIQYAKEGVAKPSPTPKFVNFVYVYCKNCAQSFRQAGILLVSIYTCTACK